MQFSSSTNSPFSTKNKVIHVLWCLPWSGTLWPGVSAQHTKMWKPPTWTEAIKGQWSSSAQSFHFYSTTNCGISISRSFWWHLTLWRQCLPTLSHQSFSQVVPATAMTAWPRQITQGLLQVSERKVSLSYSASPEVDKSSPGEHPIPCSVLEHEDAYSLQLQVEKELSRLWDLERAIPPFSGFLSQVGLEATCNSLLLPFCILEGKDFSNLSFHPH